MSVDAAELEQHRAALTGHCYRMLGSPFDADDAVRDTMVRAWRSIDRFDRRSSLRTWLYRIATHVCLEVLAHRSRRTLAIDDGPPGTLDGPLDTRPRTHWLEPVPDARAIPADADPAEQAVLRHTLRLAFVAALQHLPAKQRAALILTDVLGWSAAEVAESLETTPASLDSVLQRARATLAEKDPAAPRTTLSPAQAALVDRYVACFERYDVDALTALLTEDATLSMPPYTLWLRGQAAIRDWMAGRGSDGRGSRLVRTTACGAPAFGQYRQGGEEPWALIVLDLAEDSITGITSFLDTQNLFPIFGLPRRLPS